MDYISNLPLRIIETILCLLPIQEAARTSVLSTEWRYTWTKIPKLVFDEDTFQLSCDDDELTVPEQLFDRISQTKAMPERCRLFYAIFQLTCLYLRGCEIDEIPTFSGFGGLTTLFVEDVKTSLENFPKLLFKSPLLRTVTLNLDFNDVYYHVDSTIIDLFECLRVIEHLSLWYDFLECLASDVKLPQLVHLKYFCIEQMCFNEDKHIHKLVPVITNFPHLEKLKVEIMYGCCEDKPRGLFISKDYSDIRFECLRELDIINVSWKKAELDFVKIILAKSPVLKKVRIFLFDGVQVGEISETLSLFPRASSVVEVTVEHRRQR